MKITVWTRSSKPKCIFIGESDIVPRVDESVVCREGFASETVTDVTIDLVEKRAEITVSTNDFNDDYGPSLL